MTDHVRVPRMTANLAFLFGFFQASCKTEALPAMRFASLSSINFRRALTRAVVVAVSFAHPWGRIGNPHMLCRSS